MDADKVNRWLSLGANLGVLAGIALLVYEINQATLTTRAEMVSSHQDRWVNLDLSWQDAEFANTWATALEAPEELSTAQMIQLNGFMWAFFDHVATTRLLWNLGILDRPSIDSSLAQDVDQQEGVGNEEDKLVGNGGNNTVNECCRRR